MTPPLLLLVALWSQDLEPPLVLRPGDALRVQIQDEPAWSGDFEIGQHGTALLRPLGLVSVTGRPFAEVKNDLLRAYQREVAAPGASRPWATATKSA